MTDSYRAVLHQLRGIAENLIAGPQYRATGTVRLAVRPAGFSGTTLPVEVQGADLVWPDGRVALTGTVAELAHTVGLSAGPPEGSYEIVDPLRLDVPLDIDPDVADGVYRSLYAGGQALVEFTPDQHPVLWPEHFDVAVTADEVNYGVSPGDGFHAGPYAYVGPWALPEGGGEFWNASFGAFAPLDVAMPEPDLVARIVEFFEQGRSRV